MIKKSFLCFIVLFFLHALVVKLFPNIGMATNQRQDNVMKAQQAFYAEKIDKAIVGTSLANRILRDSIPDIQSLAFVGCSVEDGLRILNARSDVPSYVFVEINLLLKGGRKELVEQATEGLFSTIRKWIPSLREQYAPVCLFASTVIGASKLNPQAGTAKVDEEWLRQSIEGTLKEDAAIADNIVKERMEVIKSLIAQLEERGTKFVFFEMPINEHLLNIPSLVQIRDVVNTEFPTDKYDHLPSDTTSYKTTDGQHLDLEGQQRYTHFFKEATACYQ